MSATMRRVCTLSRTHADQNEQLRTQVSLVWCTLCTGRATEAIEAIDQLLAQLNHSVEEGDTALIALRQVRAACEPATPATTRSRRTLVEEFADRCGNDDPEVVDARWWVKRLEKNNSDSPALVDVGQWVHRQFRCWRLDHH